MTDTGAAPGPPDPDTILTFERVPQARASGCLVYGLIIPVFAVVLWMILGMLTAGILKWAGVGDRVAVPAFYGMSAVSVAVALIVGLKDYGRRAGSTVRVGPDFIECGKGSKATRIAFGDLAWFQASGLGPMKFVSHSRAAILTRAEEWPIREIREAFLARAIPGMKAHLLARMMDGSPVRFAVPASQTVKLFAAGVVLLTLAAVVALRMAGLRDESTWTAMAGQGGLALALFAGACGCLVLSHNERGGYVLDEAGLRAGKASGPLLAWSDLREGRVHRTGLILTFEKAARPIRISPLLPNFELLVALVKSCTPEEAWNPEKPV